MTYGERIRRGREAKALTQEELAEALGVSRQAVSKWEGDLSRPAAGKLALLSETLDIPWDAWQAMDAEEAADLARAIRPRVVVPTHYSHAAAARQFRQLLEGVVPCQILLENL